MAARPTPAIHYLWLLPEATSSARYRRRIEDLAERCGSLPFDPHITLLGRVLGEPPELLDRARRLAQRIAPFPITVEHIDHGAHYFRCVYWSAVLDPALAAARAEAEHTFGPEDNQMPFSPHLSLVYGVLDPALRQQLAADVHGERPEQFVADRLQLVAGAPNYRDWRTLDTFSLSGSTALHPGGSTNPSGTDL